MKLSKPQEYIKILLNDLCNTVEKRTSEIFRGHNSPFMGDKDIMLAKIEEIKLEIITIVKENSK